MRIDPAAMPLPPVAARAMRRTRTSGGAFALPDAAEEEPAAEATEPPSQITAATCVLAADAAGRSAAADAAQADMRAAGQGRALLGALAGLQLAALGGGGAQVRQTLADLARALPQAADPRLDEVLRAIAQRAAVELARAG